MVKWGHVDQSVKMVGRWSWGSETVVMGTTVPGRVEEGQERPFKRREWVGG